MDPLSTEVAVAKRLPTVNELGRASGRGADEKTALRSFDAYFVGEMLKRSKTENPSGLFDGGDAGRMYQDQLYQEFARIIAENTDFGLASTLEGQLANEPKEGPEPPASVDADKKESGE